MRCKIAGVGIDIGQHAVIAIDAELDIPEVIPVRTFDGYDYQLAGYAQNARIENGGLVADVTLKDEAVALVTGGTHAIAPEFDHDDYELFENPDVAVLVKGRLRGASLVDAALAPTFRVEGV